MSKKYEAISFLRKANKYTVVLLCRVIGVSKSGYYDYLKREKKPASNEDKKLLTRIKRIYTINCGTYGAKRISKELKSKGEIVNHKKVARIMREANLKSKVRIKKSTKESKSCSAGFIYENLLDRDFDADHPNQKWVTDMTELWVDNQKVYISALMDLFNREIIAFEISDSPNLQLIQDTIEGAQRKRKLKTLNGVLIHSDQGSVYRSHMYSDLSKSLGFTPSMSRKANCWDNAVIESFFSQLKVEFPCFYPNYSRASYKGDLSAYIKRFNGKRIQERLGFISPKSYYLRYKKSA